MSSPKLTLRSNSTSGFSLTDIQQLINSSKNEIISSFKSELDKVNNSVLLLTARIQTIEEKLAEVKKKNDKHENEIRNINELLTKISAETPSNLLEEIEKRNVRRCNLILSGVAEPTSGTVEERNKYDQNETMRIIHELGLPNVEIDNTLRIGQSHEDKPRLLKVTCKDVKQKIEVLRKGKELRNSSAYKHVFINPDLTPMQQKEAFLLRNEMKRRKSQGEDVIIWHNKVILRSEMGNFRRRF